MHQAGYDLPRFDHFVVNIVFLFFVEDTTEDIQKYYDSDGESASSTAPIVEGFLDLFASRQRVWDNY